MSIKTTHPDIQKLQFFEVEGCVLSYGGKESYDSITKIICKNCGNVDLGKQMPDLPYTLREIRVINCGLSGSIPLLPSRIHTVDLSGNELTGIIPNLPSLALSYLNLDNNYLTGSIPNLPKGLKKLNLSNNGLSGTIPQIPGSLNKLSLSNNSLKGTISLLSDLTVLELANNDLSGTISHIGTDIMNLANNRFSGEIVLPVDYNPSTFNIECNHFIDQPGQFCRISNEEKLQFFKGVKGIIPYQLCDAPDTITDEEKLQFFQGVKGIIPYQFCAVPDTTSPTLVPTDMPTTSPTSLPTSSPTDIRWQNIHIPTNTATDTPTTFVHAGEQCVGYEQHKNTACGGSNNSKLAINCVEPDKCSNFLTTDNINECYNLCKKDENCKGFVKTDVIESDDPANIKCSFRKTTDTKNEYEGKVCYEKKYIYIPNFFGCGN